MQLQTIVEKGKTVSVIVPIAKWDAILAQLEGREDIADATRQMTAIRKGEESLHAEIVARLTSGVIPLKVWREYRGSGFTLRALAVKIAISSAAVPRIEAGKSRPTVATLAKLAAAPGCEMEDLT